MFRGLSGYFNARAHHDPRFSGTKPKALAIPAMVENAKGVRPASGMTETP